MNIWPEHLLKKCAQCEAWPMAIAKYENNWLVFKCPKCLALQTYRLGAAGRIVLASV